MSLVSFFRDKIKAVLTNQNEAVIEVSIIDPNNPDNRIIPDANGKIGISTAIITGTTEVEQDTHDDLNANMTLQISDVDAPGGAGVVTPSTPRIVHASDDPAVIALQTIENMISGNEAQVDVITSALPAGASTEATLAAASAKLPATLGQKASTASLSAVLSTEQEVILTALKTALEIIDNVVNGNEAQVDVVTSALPTGASTDGKLDEIKTLIGEVQISPTENTILDRLKDLLTGIVLATGSNAIGKLAANSGVDIGDVDVTSLPQAASVPFGTVVIAATATAQQLPANVAKQGVIVVANELNDASNIVYLGFSNLVTNVTYLKQLLPGEATPLLPVTNSNVIWVYCVFTGGTHSYNYAVF
jgi:hypothetical protein